MLTLITGGARSGKSAQALKLAGPFPSRVFVATAQAFDDEMTRRIEAHQEERRGAFETLEEPMELATALRRIPPSVDVVVVDCLTVWLGNLTYAAEQRGEAWLTEPRESQSVMDFLDLLGTTLPWHLVLVSNELGMGLVPMEPMGRAFRDLAGRVNQEVARRAQQVLFMVSGLPMTVKAPSDGMGVSDGNGR